MANDTAQECFESEAEVVQASQKGANLHFEEEGTCVHPRSRISMLRPPRTLTAPARATWKPPVLLAQCATFAQHLPHLCLVCLQAAQSSAMHASIPASTIPHPWCLQMS